jgi:hypothetical protein
MVKIEIEGQLHIGAPVIKKTPAWNELYRGGEMGD